MFFIDIYYLCFFPFFFNSDDYIDVDCKDMTTRYSNDVIASCAFGLKVDSQKEKNNEFYVMGKTSTSFNFRQLIMFLLIMNVPKIAKVGIINQ